MKTTFKSFKGAVNQNVNREDICIFTCSSLELLEITQVSDLNLFFVKGLYSVNYSDKANHMSRRFRWRNLQKIKNTSHSV